MAVQYVGGGAKRSRCPERIVIGEGDVRRLGQPSAERASGCSEVHGRLDRPDLWKVLMHEVGRAVRRPIVDENRGRSMMLERLRKRRGSVSGGDDDCQPAIGFVDGTARPSG